MASVATALEELSMDIGVESPVPVGPAFRIPPLILEPTATADPESGFITAFDPAIVPSTVIVPDVVREPEIGAVTRIPVMFSPTSEDTAPSLKLPFNGAWIAMPTELFPIVTRLLLVPNMILPLKAAGPSSRRPILLLPPPPALTSEVVP